MKNVAKWLAALVGLGLLLVITAAVVLPRVVDPNDYKETFVAELERRLGRKLTIPGDLELSVFPWLGVRVGPVRLDNPSDFETTVFAAIEQLQVRVRIVPLLSQKVEADVISIRGLQIYLERNLAGRTNWEDLLQAKDGDAALPGRDPNASPLAALAVGGVEIQDATLRWFDRKAGRRITVSDLDLHTSEVSLFKPVQLKLAFDLDTGDLGVSGHVEGQARVDMQLRRRNYTFAQLALTADFNGAAIPGGAVRMKAGGEAAFDAARRRFFLSGLRLDALDLKLAPYTLAASVMLDGQANLDALSLDLRTVEAAALLQDHDRRLKAVLAGQVQADLSTGTVALPQLTLAVPELQWTGVRGELAPAGKGAAELDLQKRTFRIDWLSLQGDLTLDALPGAPVPVRLAASVAGDLQRQAVQVDPLGVQIGNVKGVGKLRAEFMPGQPKIIGSFGLDPFNPRTLLSRFGVVLPAESDANTLTTARLFLDIGASPDEVRIANLNLVVDDSRMTGSARVRNFSDPVVRFDLQLDALDVDRYRPSQTKASAAAAAAAGPVVGPALLPAAFLRKLDLEGTLGVGRLKVGGLTLDGTQLAVHAGDGHIRIDPLTTRLYGGRFRADVLLDVQTPDPRIFLDEDFTGVQLERLLADLGVRSLPVNLSGPSSFSLKGSLTADPAFRKLTIRGLSAQALLAGKDFGQGSLPMGLDVSGVVDLSEGTLAADRLVLTVAGMELQAADARVQGMSADPSYSASLQTPDFNLRNLLQRLGRLPETADEKALAAAALSATVTGSTEGFSVQGLALHFDDTHVTGHLDATLRPAPAYAFDFRVDGVDIDRYLPPSDSGRPAVAATPGAAAAVLPVETLRGLTLDGKLSVGHMKAANLRVRDISLVASARDGQGVLQPLTAKLYGGTYSGNVRYDAREDLLRLQVDEALRGVQAGPLFEDLQGRTFITGLSDISMKLSAAGADNDALLRSLSGTTLFSFQDGAVMGVDILGTLCRSLSAFAAGTQKTGDILGGALQMLMRPKPQSMTGTQGVEARTEFSELKGSVAFTGGVGTNRDLVLQSPLLRVEGAGRLDLPNALLDYSATAALVESCEGQGGKGMRELTNYPIPVRIFGPLNGLRVEPDITAGILEILRRQQTRKAETSAGPKTADTDPSATTPPAEKPPAEPQPPPQTPEQQAEEAVNRLLQKGLRDLFQKQ